jgi:hypothetical protein
MSKSQSLFKFFVLATVALCIVLARQNSYADPIVYGDILSPEVGYLQITENSVTDAFPDGPTEGVTGLYGLPEMLGDSLLFNVPTFAAHAIGGPAVDLTDGFLTFGLEAGEDLLLTELFIEEFGSLNLLSPLGGSDLTNVGFASPIFLDIQEVVFEDGTPAGRRFTLDEPVTVVDLNLNIAPNPGVDRVFGFASEPNAVSWIADLDVDLVEELVAARPNIVEMGDVRGVVKLQFSMNNTLSASAEDVFASAFIDKKQVSINPTLIVNVPEPATWLALLLMLPAAAGWRRR